MKVLDLKLGKVYLRRLLKEKAGMRYKRTREERRRKNPELHMLKLRLASLVILRSSEEKKVIWNMDESTF